MRLTQSISRTSNNRLVRPARQQNSNLLSEDRAENSISENYDENLFREDYAKTISSDDYDENLLSEDRPIYLSSKITYNNGLPGGVSSQEITIDAGRIEKWVEQKSAATAEWSAKRNNEAEEDSELRPPGIDTTTEAFEPGGRVAEVTPKLGSEAQDKLLPVEKQCE